MYSQFGINLYIAKLHGSLITYTLFYQKIKS